MVIRDTTFFKCLKFKQYLLDLHVLRGRCVLIGELREITEDGQGDTNVLETE